MDNQNQPSLGDIFQQYRLSAAVVVIGLTAIVMFLVGAAIWLPATDVGSMRFGQILALASPLVMLLANSLRIEQAAHNAASIKGDTKQLLNGAMDAKLTEVIHRELLAHDQLVHGVDGGHSTT